MTDFELARFGFGHDAVREWSSTSPAHSDWPVVYLLDSGAGEPPRAGEVETCVSETLGAQARLRQNLDSRTTANMRSVRVILNERFNKSAALDPESF